MPTPIRRAEAPAVVPAAAPSVAPAVDDASSLGSLTDIANALGEADTFDAPTSLAEAEAAAATTPKHGSMKLDTAPNIKRPVLFYNQYCETCDAIAGMVKKADRRGGDVIDEQSIPKYQEDLDKMIPGLKLEDVYTTSHLVMPDGTVYRGGDAVREVLERLSLTGWFSDVFGIKVGEHMPFQAILNKGYALLDAIRPALGCTSCGPNATPTWAKPIKWVVDAVKKLMGKDKPDTAALPA